MVSICLTRSLLPVLILPRHHLPRRLDRIRNKILKQGQSGFTARLALFFILNYVKKTLYNYLVELIFKMYVYGMLCHG